MTLQHDRLNQLATEITEWGERQGWTFFGPKIGVLEELGELAHCILKNRQKIRGMDDPKVFKDKLGDALADICIYCLNDLRRRGLNFFAHDDFTIDTDSLFDPDDQGALEEALGRFADTVSVLLGDHDYEIGGWQIHYSIIMHCHLFAVTFGLNLAEEIERIWARVSKRDWTANREKAADIEEQERLVNEKPSVFVFKDATKA